MNMAVQNLCRWHSPAHVAVPRAGCGRETGRMTSVAEAAFVFGPFRLLAARRELSAHGVPVTLGQRAFDVLLALVRRHGELVTKDELMAEVWPGIAVEENNLQVHVSALRKVLGAAGDDQRYLLTVAGRGYRFVAPVDCESNVPAEAARRIGQTEEGAGAAVPAIAASNNLPRQLTALIGREADLEEIKARLRSSPPGDADRVGRRRQDPARDRGRRRRPRPTIRTAYGSRSSRRSTMRSW